MSIDTKIRAAEIMFKKGIELFNDLEAQRTIFKFYNFNGKDKTKLHLKFWNLGLKEGRKRQLKRLVY